MSQRLNGRSSWLAGVVILLMAFAAGAHNKVVVVPLFDDLEVEILAPLTKTSPPDADYTEYTFTVVDNVTGLEWQRQDDDTSRNWNDALQYCAGLALIARPDWRLPSIHELTSIIDFAGMSPLINNSVFPGTDLVYWSATGDSNVTINAWRVNFSLAGGAVELNLKSATNRVRCVRNTTPSGALLTNNGNATVTDVGNGLIWQRAANTGLFFWANAAGYCQNLSLGGSNAWRLPNIKELLSLVEYRESLPAINKIFTGSISGTYWSATFIPGSLPDGGDDVVWTVNFDNGNTVRSFKNIFRQIRCVR